MACERGYAIETIKLRVKIGPHEFEAEGPQDSVTAQFEAWRKIVARPSAPAPIPDGKIRSADAAAWSIFDIEPKKKLLTLKAHPEGENREGDAVLLILYGHKQVYREDEVAVTKLMEALRLSGLQPERIDRAVGSHARDGLLLRSGRGKGGRYRLTNTGLARADEMARALIEKTAV